MDPTLKDPTHCTLNFEEELDDETSSDNQQSTDGDKATKAPANAPSGPRMGAAHCFKTFRSNSGSGHNPHKNHLFQSNLRTSNNQSSTFAAADSDDSTILHNNSSLSKQSNVETIKSSIHNPYSKGRTPFDGQGFVPSE
jgi:hypothetical protein